MRRISFRYVTLLLLFAGLSYGMWHLTFDFLKKYHLFEAAPIDSPLMIQLGSNKLNQLIQESASRSLRLDKNEDQISFNQGYLKLYQLIKDFGYEDHFNKESILLIFQPEGFCGVINLKVKRLSQETLLRFVNGAKIVKNNFKGYSIFQIHQKNANQLVVAQYKNLLLWANHALLVEAAIDILQETHKSFYTSDYYQAEEVNEKEIKIWINNESMKQKNASFLLDDQEVKLVQFSLGMNADEWDGIIWPAKTSKLLGGTRPKPKLPTFHLSSIIPANTNHLIHFQSALVNANLQKEVNQYLGNPAHFLMIPELGMLELNNSPILLLRLQDVQVAEQQLASLFSSQQKDYNTFTIRQLNLKQPFQIGKRVISTNPYTLILDDYLLLSDKLSDLEMLIDYYINSNSLIQEIDFLTQLGRFNPNHIDLLLYQSGWPFSTILNQLPKTIATVLPKDDLQRMTTQVLYWDQNKWSFEGKMSRKKESISKLNILWKQVMPSTIIGQPQIVRHGSEIYILFQDAKWNVYCFNKEGEQLWQKKLNGPILGKWKKINYYNKHALELLGNTKNELLILDMKGKTVGPFPVKLENPTRCEATFTSFDQGYSFVIFVTGSNGQIYAFDRMGVPFSEWKLKDQLGSVTFPIVPLQTSQNNFLFVQNDSGTVFTFNRFGDLQFEPIQLDTNSISPIGVQQHPEFNRAVIVDQFGKARIISDSGESFPLQLAVGKNSNTQFVLADIAGDSRKEYVLLSGDDLIVYSYQKNKLERLYENKLNNEDNQVFEITTGVNNRSIIGILDQKAAQIFLFDAKGNLLPGFPISGSTVVDIGLLSDQNQFLLVVGYQDAVYVYQLRQAASR